jgi:hypothetical protein
MEALALMLIHILTPGGLPWTRNGVPRDDAAHEKLKREKRDTLPATLCADMPDVLQDFLHYCRGLGFTTQPDYELWIERFLEVGEELGLGDVTPFLWPPPPLPAVRVVFTCEAWALTVVRARADRARTCTGSANKRRVHQARRSITCSTTLHG